MVLTVNGKNYIANNFGIGNCFVVSGLSWTAVDINDVTADESGGTAQIIARLLSTAVYKEIRVTSPSIQAGTYTNAQLISANDDQTITVTEVSTEIAGKDGSPVGEDQYCTEVCVPIWQCETPLNGWEFDGCGNRRENIDCSPLPSERVGEFVFEPPVGGPTIDLDLSELQMRQATDGHFEMNGIKIINTSEDRVFLAIRIKLFIGSLTVCQEDGFIFDGIDRTIYKNVRVKELQVGETAIYNADFYQPATILGLHTICMLIHGAWSNADVLDEIELITR